MHPLVVSIVGATLLCAALCATAASQPPAQPAVGAEVPLREPQAVHNRLRAICTDAGYRPGRFDECARAISRRCATARIDPSSARCWQWLVDQDSGGVLDRRTLGTGATSSPGRHRP